MTEQQTHLETPKPTRYWLSVLKIIIPFLLITGTFQYFGMCIAGVDFQDLDAPRSSGQDFTICFFALAGKTLTVWLFRKYIDKETFLSLGFNRYKVNTDVLMGLMMGFFIMATSFSVLLLAHQIQFKALNFSLSNLLYSTGFFIFAAAAEEVLVRGYMLNNLLKSCNKYLALAISSVIFSLLHAFNPNINVFALFELFLAGVLLGLAYIYTQSLWFAIALHFSWNFFQCTIFGFNVSGLQKYNLIITARHNDNIWNGGVFGYEGSLTSVFFQLAAIGVVYFIFNKQAANYAIVKQIG